MRTLFAWILLLHAPILSAQILTAQAHFPSEPAAVRALRVTNEQAGGELREAATALRNASPDPTTRAWATLALVEIEHELEQEDAASALIEELDQSSVALTSPTCASPH